MTRTVERDVANDDPGSTAVALGKRAARKAETRERLLASALALFTQDGYRATSIESIATAAGLSRVGFYLHFTGLADLAKELVRPAIKELLTHYGRLDTLAPTRDNLGAWSRSLIDLWHANAVRIRIGEHIVEVDPAMRSLWAAEIDDTASVMPIYLARWDAEGRHGIGLLRLIALLLQHERLCYLTMSAQAPIDEALLIELISEQCWVLLCRDVAPGATSFGFTEPAARISA